MFKKPLTLAAVLCALTSLSVRAQNLIPNGDFSTGNLQNWWVTGGSVDVVPLTEGRYGAQFANEVQSQLVQSQLESDYLKTVAGQQYTLSYNTFNSGFGYYFVSLVGIDGYHDYAWNGTTNMNAPGITGSNSFSITYVAMQDDYIFISYSGSAPGTISNLTVVPEPSTCALFGAGALLAFGVYRRKRH